MKTFKTYLNESIVPINADMFARRIINKYGIDEKQLKELSRFAKGANSVVIKIDLLDEYDIDVKSFIEFCENICGWYSAKNYKLDDSNTLTLMKNKMKYNNGNGVFYRITGSSRYNEILQYGMKTVTSDSDDAFWHYKDRIYMFTEDSLLNVIRLMSFMEEHNELSFLSPTKYEDVIAFNIAWALKDIGNKPGSRKKFHLWKINLPDTYPIYDDIAVNKYDDNGAVYTTQDIPKQFIESKDEIMDMAIKIFNDNADIFPKDGE